MCSLTAPAERSLPADVLAPRLARQFLQVHACPHTASIYEDAALLVSEIVTNAVSHAGPPISIRLECHDTALVVSVHDGAHALHPAVRGAHDVNEGLADGELNLDEGGRGLAFVDLLADSLKIRPDESGKTISLTLDLSRGLTCEAA